MYLFEPSLVVQLSYFPGDGAFSLSHQTAELLDALLRKGLAKGEEGGETDRYDAETHSMEVLIQSIVAIQHAQIEVYLIVSPPHVSCCY